MKDRDLIRSFLEGNPEAIDLLREWIRGVSARYRSRLGPEVEDVEQDVLVDLTKALRDREFEARSQLRGYVGRFVHHKCIDLLRRRQRRPTSQVSEEELPVAEALALDRLLEKDRSRVLLQVVSEMPERCRQLWGWISEGLSYKEMASRLGVSQGSLRVQVLRCRRKALARRDQLMKELGGSP